MRRNLLLVLLVFSLVFLFSQFGFSQVNEFSLVPVDLQICPGCDSTIQVNINISTVDYIVAFQVPLFAEGTSNPVLDTVLTGGLSSYHPVGFSAPSLVSSFTQCIVDPYGPPDDPLLFTAVGFGDSHVDSGFVGLYCRMFYRASGPGTLTFRTAVHSTGGPAAMWGTYGTVTVDWPESGEVGSFTITQMIKPRGNVNCDELTNVQDVIHLVSYLFRGGPSPHPLENGDLNCDGKVTVSDVLYLVNYLFKGGPQPC